MAFTDLHEGVLELFAETHQAVPQKPFRELRDQVLLLRGAYLHHTEYMKQWRTDQRARRAISEGRPVGRVGRPPIANPTPFQLKERERQRKRREKRREKRSDAEGSRNRDRVNRALERA